MKGDQDLTLDMGHGPRQIQDTWIQSTRNMSTANSRKETLSP